MIIKPSTLGPPPSQGDNLLLEIFRCTVPPQIFEEAFSPAQPHPCRKVVDAQFSDANSSIVDTDSWHRPEPWSGPLAVARLLFVSSNPSYAHDEVYPSVDATAADVVHFFNNRFADREFTDVNGFPARIARNANGDRQYARGSQFWPAIQRLAKDLLGDARGQLSAGHVCMTELVHCKSRQEVGVKEAVNFCERRYMSRILEESPANVVVVLGKHAKKLVCSTLGIEPPSSPSTHLSGGRRYAFSAHPNGWRMGGGLRSQWNDLEAEFDDLILSLSEEA
jgi:uracil-DNA glycosylase